MSDFWAGILLGALIGFFAGIVASVIANYLWELGARYKAYKAARKLVGTWEAYDLVGRKIAGPMKGAGLTVISVKHRWWVADSRVLDVRSEDIDVSTGQTTRKHDGAIILHPASPWLAFRVDRYADSDEIAQQQLLLDPKDPNIVFVFPDPSGSILGPVYAKHAWRRKC